MAKQKQIKETIFVEIDGITYEGYRIITGVREMRQTIYYKDLSELDNYTYNKTKMSNPEGLMRSSAEYFLKKLVREYHRLS